MYEYAAKLVRIIDGDTFVANLDLGFSTTRKETVRMSGINTPESRTRDLEEKRHGLAAKKVLSGLLKEASELVITVEDIGKFGRALGVVYADGVDINTKLIDDGYAYPYTGQKKMTYQEMLVEYPLMDDVYKKLTKGLLLDL
jgi:micrococcal nuclease|tara:strand:- start:320 stop:745 length:426 start_codon:yes stop_codon:yes gene_type:complete